MKNAIHFPFFKVCGSRAFIVFLFVENSKYITGKPNQVTTKEQTNVIIIVFVRILKYAPATPLNNMKGKKMTMVLADEPTIAGNRNFIDFESNSFVGVSGCSSWVR